MTRARKAGLATISFLGVVTLSRAWVEPLALALASTPFEADEELVGDLRVIPEVSARPQSPGERLEQRLAALASDIEARSRARRGARPLLEFDVLNLNLELETLLAPIAEQAELSVQVRDLESQHVLFDYYGDTPLQPASNYKLLTSSAAIDLLGGDYVFQTRVALRGDRLFLIGEGDPTLNVTTVADLAREVATHVSLVGIDHLVVDDTAFSPERFGPGYALDGIGLSHEAPSGALSLSFNTVEVTVSVVPGRSKLAVALAPDNGHLVLRSSAKVGTRDTLEVVTRADRDTTRVEVSGRLPRSARSVVLRRRVTDPGRFAGAEFAAALATASGSEPLAVELGRAPPDSDVIAVQESSSLVEIVDAGLAFSNNFMAEQILRTLAWRMTGTPGSWDGGRDVLQGYWQALGQDPASMVFENGAGLSGMARMSGSGLVDLISVAHRSGRGGGPGLLDTLPVAGEAGTLRARLRLSGKRVRAKTGTMDGITGLSGVITSEDGIPQIAFSILINARNPARLLATTRQSIADRVVMTVLHHLDAFEGRKALARPSR